MFGSRRADKDPPTTTPLQGHVVADVQLPLPADGVQGGAKAAPAPAAAALDVVENSGGVTVTGADGLCVEVRPTDPESNGRLCARRRRQSMIFGALI